MLESNLQELQVEYKRTRTLQAAANHTQYESFNLHKSESSENIHEQGRKEPPSRSFQTASNPQTPKANHEVARRPSVINSSAKPVLEEMARTVNSVRDFLPNKSILNSLNPFGNGSGSDDEYDASGKNPFSE